MTMELYTGIYEQIINKLFHQKIMSVDREQFYVGERALTKDDAVHLLSKYLEHLLETAFSDAPEQQSPEQCARFVNSVIKALGREFSIEDNDSNLIDASHKILTAVIDKSDFGYTNVKEYLAKITPLTTLSKCALFMGGQGAADMHNELNREILSADEICWVVSFIKVSGLNLVYESLKKYTNSGKRLRIITTTYTGATHFQAVKKIAELPNTEVKISYDGTQDRLHAKSYIFLRKSGFHTAYIGSSNLSHSALKDGKEWNFKATQFELPHVIASVRHSFDSYWFDETFETFIPGVDDERLKAALGYETEAPLDFSAFDLMRAKDYQQEILEKLEVEREVHGHYKNLIVAATGTGKTVIAAFDFKRFRAEHPNCRFLFIAHREEILKQALNTFRIVLEDANFGDIWTGNHEPKSYEHIFASKDTMRNRMDILKLSEDYYDYMIVDEVHHVVAPSYVKIVTYFKPKILLGLTATPERMNINEDITVFFDGHISAEIRLPAALNAGLLSPFYYYGITDNIDLTEVSWHNGGYDSVELSKIYTQNDNRTKLILDKIQEYLGPNLRKVRALCFCVDVRHAEYMHAKFTLAGLKSAVLTGTDNHDYRVIIRNKFARGDVNYLFVVDLFNEGVDIPEIDTVLFLRPTESVTIFLQQFGRGLRKAEGKHHLTVFDFVGHCRTEFNYKDRFEALLGRSTQGIAAEIECGFPHRPFGCEIILEEKAQEDIINNIRAFIQKMNRATIIKEIRAYQSEHPGRPRLKDFLKERHVPLDKIYKSMSWYEMCVAASCMTEISSYSHCLWYAVSKKWLSTDSYSYFARLKAFVDNGFHYDYFAFSKTDIRYATMFYYDLFNEANQFQSIEEMFRCLSREDLFIEELSDLLDIMMERCSAPEKKDNSVYSDWNPLRLHGVYTKAQIQAALGFSTINYRSSSREGVERKREIQLEAMYVDVIKQREIGSTTDYKDFAQNREFFHWETQNRVSANGKEAAAYRSGANHMLLFVRQQAEHPELGCRMGFTYLGEVDLSSIEGDRPMQIVWKLRTPMSEATYSFASQYKAIG